MSRVKPFHYTPNCTAAGCPQPAIYKIAALWSDGTSQELKSYGLVCETHRQERYEQACERSALLSRTADESVGPVEIFRLEPDRRDAELTRVSR